MALIMHRGDGVRTEMAAIMSSVKNAMITCGVVGALGLCVSGCSTNRVRVATDDSTVDVRQKHPIALVEKQYQMDLFPHAPLDSHTRDQVQEFAEHYKKLGHGPITILIPKGSASAALSGKTVGALRTELAKHSAGAHVIVSHYPVSNPGLAAPVRLSFEGLGAKVVNKCGEWPRDLGVGSLNSSWENKPYYNFGCSSQSMLATQVDDPRDLATPRANDPADMAMRVRAIKKVREGKDPGTEWRVKNSAIGVVGQ